MPVPPDKPGVARVIAIANQKGGVGKSTTAVSLGAALADLGYRVLVVDLDPQGNASTGLGIRHEAREITVYDVIVAEASVVAAIVQTPVQRLSAVPSTIDLAGAEIELVSQFSRETRLKKALSSVREGMYDFILLDCPPSLGLLTINALTAAEELLVPIQCEYYALEGLGQLLRNVSLVQQNINPGLRLSGIVMTMFDPRTKLSEQVVEEVRRYFGQLVYDVIIPRTVRLSEAPGFGQPITVYDPKSKGAASYRELGREVALRPPPTEPMPVFDDLPTVVVPPLDTAPAPTEPLSEDELGEVPMVHELTVEAADGVPEPEPEPEPELEPEPEPEQEPETEPARAGEPAMSAADPPTEPEPESDATSELEEPAPPGAPSPTSSDRPQGRPSAQPPAHADDDVWEEADEPIERPRVTPPRSPVPPGHLPERRVVVIDEDSDELPEPSQPSRAGDREAEASEGHAVADIGATLQDDDGSRKRRWRLFRKGGK
jgi:chromosome partitioning protein